MVRYIRFTGKVSGMLDGMVPDVGLHFSRNQVHPCDENQAELLLRNKDFEEVADMEGNPLKNDAFVKVTATNAPVTPINSGKAV